MNKIILGLLCGLSIISAEALNAQDTAPTPEKEIIVIDFFARNRIVPVPYAQALRAQVMQGFADRKRHRIIDAETLRELSLGSSLPVYTDPATAAAEQAAFLQARMQQMTAIGARYAVTGTLVNYKFEHIELPQANSKERPRQGFRATFNIALSACDLKLCRMLPDELITLTGVAPVAEDADMLALNSIRSKMEFYINRNFKFETTILQLCPPDKKGRIRELYIHCGTDMGVKPGDLFMVYEDVPIGGVMTRQKVGRLRVNDVQNYNVAKCKIAAGNDEIINAFEQGRGLSCVSDGQALF